ncbi:MAG: response regulator transcription factor [Anaerolineales bacterium]|nr:response regulator transcription factor [Anaerolineales bacterium]
MNSQFVLVVEDEPSIAEIATLYLRRAGYKVQTAKDGQKALDLISAQMPDLIVLDLMLPQVDGYELTRWIRDQSNVPIIMLTARRSESDRIAGLEMGADEYIVKPFSPQELVSRVRAVLRRTMKSPMIESEKPLSFQNLTIDPRTRLVIVNTLEIILTVKEFDLLWLLACHPRQVFSRQRLLENVWGISDYIDPGTVTVHIRRLREKIEADPSNPEMIVTVWGVGYKFEP